MFLRFFILFPSFTFLFGHPSSSPFSASEAAASSAAFSATSSSASASTSGNETRSPTSSFSRSSLGACEAVPQRCACRSAAGIVELSPLAQLLSTSPNYKGYLETEASIEGTTSSFFFNPCTFLSTVNVKCQEHASCLRQLDKSPPSYTGIGLLKNVQYNSLPGSTIQLAYSTATIYESLVDCICNRAVIKNPSFTFTGKSPPGLKTTFQFRLTHACCCPDVCKDGLPGGGGGDDGRGGGGMSYGTLIAILFGVSVVGYLFAGITFQKYRRGESGTNLIPNREFWCGFPSLVRDGALFIFFTCKGSKGYSYIPVS